MYHYFHGYFLTDEEIEELDKVATKCYNNFKEEMDKMTKLWYTIEVDEVVIRTTANP